MSRILIAEDNPKQAALIALHLRHEGHHVTVAGDGHEALEAARREAPDLVILDVMMPGIDGLTVCRALRRESRVAILMLTARSTEGDLVDGLDAGADDYLTKPYGTGELAARVRALLRRAGVTGQPLRYGDLDIDPAQFEVRIEGEPAGLTVKEFSILEMLATSPGQVFSRGQIIERVFGMDSDVLERTVDVHVKNLRRKLRDDSATPRWVQTVYGRGYRFAR
ncbi:response regulator transcription factor [Actinoplanes sp. CA-054009]